jgi:hypothetical protein
VKNYLFFILFSTSVLSASAQDQVTSSQISGAEKMFGLSFSQAKRDSMISVLSAEVKTYNYIHSINLDNSIPFPLWFNPVLPGTVIPEKSNKIVFTIPGNVELPKKH